MKVKYICDKCGAEDAVDGDRTLLRNWPTCGKHDTCHKCGKRTWHNARYFPEADGNKVFAVDVWLTVSHCMKVEAKDGDEAERIARDRLCDQLQGCSQSEALEVLGVLGFEDSDEQEYKTSGEADEHGEIQYY